MRISRPEPSDDRRAARSRGPSRAGELFAALREAEAARGFLTFATYMDLALFHPTAGYYARLESVGAAGDFATSPSLTPVFGRLFARQFAQIWREMGSPRVFDVIEAGPGAGQFAESVLMEAARMPRFAKALRYGLMERSASLREKQATRLARWAGRIRQGETIEALAPEGVRGIIFSNEFFDALPCHRLQQTAEGLREVGLRVEGSRLQEVLVPPTSERLASELAASDVVLREGQRVEVSLAALDAMAAMAGRLARGALITVDYGDVAREVHDARRPQGSLRGYFQHMRVEDPYARPGEQDLTYDVDFTALARAGERAGLSTWGLLPQGEVLQRLGIAAEIRAARRGKSRLAADQASAPLEQISHPQGMGEGFKVLFQGRDLAPATLAALGGRPLRRGLWPFGG